MSGERGEMTVRQAGKKGGETVKARYGSEHYVRIGKKGGETVARERGPEFFAEIGKRRVGKECRSRWSPYH